MWKTASGPPTSGLRLRVSGAVSVSLAENSADLTLTLDDQPCAEILSLLDGETFDLILEEEVSIDATHEVKAYVTDALGEKPRCDFSASLQRS